MPIHDWSRVPAGVFHDFHIGWVAEISRALNKSHLPSAFYCQIEPADWPAFDTRTDGQHSGISNASPGVAMVEAARESTLLARRRRRLVIRHGTGDRIIAYLDLVSSGVKESGGRLEEFINGAAGAIKAGYHLIIVDLLPPGALDPTGLHGAVWSRFHGGYIPPPDKLLTLASYVADSAVTCYVEPTAVGTPLIDMPLFLDPGHYVNVPLEATYMAAYEGVPRRWKSVIEG